MNDWTDEDPPTPSMGPATYYRLSTNFCPCDDCQADDGAQTTTLDPEEFN